MLDCADLVVDNLNEGVIALDQHAVITFVNDALCRMVGYTREELVGGRATDFLDQAGVDTFNGEFDKRKSGQDGAYELTFRRQDGEIGTALTSARPLFDEDGSFKGSFALIADITDRKRLEAELQRSKERHELAVGAGGVGVWDWNLVTGELDLDPASKALVWYRDHQTADGTDGWDQVLPAEDLDRLWAEVKACFEGRKDEFAVEHRAVFKDGSVHWYLTRGALTRDAAGKPRRMLGASTDITERKQLEEELRGSMERWRLLFECAPDGCFLSDLEGRFVDANAAAEEIVGYKKEELLGKSFLRSGMTLVPPRQLAKAAGVVAKTAMGKPSGPDEFTLNRKDGTQAPVEVRTFPVHIDGQRLTLGIARDISERKQAERTLRAAHDELERRVKERTAELAEANAQLTLEIEERARAEKLLRASEEKFRFAFDKGPLAFGLASPDGRITRVNDAFCRLVGYTSGELVGKSFADIPHPDDIEESLTLTRRLFAGEVPEFTLEKRYLTKESKTIWVRVVATVFHDVFGDETTAMGIVEDITDRRRTERETLRRHKMLAGINRVLETAIQCDSGEAVGRTCLAVAEELTDSEFGLIGELNEAGRFDTIAQGDAGWAACRIPHSEAVKMIRDMEVRGVWGRVLEDGESLIANQPGSHPDCVGVPEGHPRLTSFLGVPLKRGGETFGMIAVANKAAGYDSSDQEAMEALSVSFVAARMRRRAEELMERSEAKFRGLAERSFDVIYTIDHQGHFTYVSPAVERILGESPEGMVGRHFADFLPESEALRVVPMFQRAVVGEDLGGIQVEAKRNDGTTVPVECNATPIVENGKMIGAQGIVRDVTERRLVETLQGELTHAARLAAIGEMATGIAHELNQPLAAIATWADVAMREFGLDGPDSRREAGYALERLAEVAEYCVRSVKCGADVVAPVNRGG